MTTKVLYETNDNESGDWFRLSVNGEVVGEGHSVGPHDLEALVKAINNTEYERQDKKDEDFL